MASATETTCAETGTATAGLGFDHLPARNWGRFAPRGVLLLVLAFRLRRHGRARKGEAAEVWA